MSAASPQRHEVMWGQDGNATKRMQDEQVIVTADNMGSLATDRQLQELVVLRVTTISHHGGHVYQLCLPHQCRQKFHAFFFLQVLVEARTAEHVIPFCYC